MLNNSEDQITTLNNLEAFLHSKSNLMIITGKAGTGKTTLVRQIQEKAYENNWKTISLGVDGKIDIPRYWYTAVSRAKKLLYVLPS